MVAQSCWKTLSFFDLFLRKQKKENRAPHKTNVITEWIEPRENDGLLIEQIGFVGYAYFIK